MRALSKVAPEWWDYTTLDKSILDAAAKITINDLKKLERPGFKINIFDTLQEFYAAEALEYVKCWQQATAANPAGICGPIGPTEQLPIVAQIVNDLNINLKNCHFWGMDEWIVDGKAADINFPLGFAKADMDLCFNRIRPELRMPKENMHFPTENTEEYRQLGTRHVELHPITLIQNARTSGGGTVQNVPNGAVTVGPVETWKAENVSIWHPGHHDNPFGQRLTAYMISNKIADSAVPMSLLSDHPSVIFNYYRGGFGVCDVEMH